MKNDALSESLNALNSLIDTNAQVEGFTCGYVNGAGIFRASEQKAKAPQLYEPLICLITQGEKQCHVGNVTYHYKEGDFFINFLPMPVETQVVVACKERPFLSAALDIDLVRLADMVLQLDRIDGSSNGIVPDPGSCVLVGKANEQLVDVFYRLINVSLDKIDAAILGNNIIDEIYYRVLTSEYGYALRLLLSQYGAIQPISKAVNYIHNNLDKTIQVQQLASLSNMSKTSFFSAFKRLMHVPPNQYIKATKLQKAQALLKQGTQAGEASFLVGYNSFSQFSREYKRFYGFPPSETQILV